MAAVRMLLSLSSIFFMAAIMAVLMDRKEVHKYEQGYFDQVPFGIGWGGAIFPYVGWRNWFRASLASMMMAGLIYLIA